jgi:solute carrier family 25 (mitochondrial phosphate transporter), member 3
VCLSPCTDCWTVHVTGWFKFGGVEFFKIKISQSMSEQSAWDNRNLIYLASSAMAEFIADIFLCPLEATRIRLVSNPSFADGLLPAATRLFKEDGIIKGFYSGFGPILLKQASQKNVFVVSSGTHLHMYAHFLP